MLQKAGEMLQKAGGEMLQKAGDCLLEFFCIKCYDLLQKNKWRVTVPKKLITKSNALIEASYRLSLNEMRIILYGISLINPIKPVFPLNYRIDIKRFADLFNISHNDIYTDLKEVVLTKFWERDFSYINEQGKTVVLRWLTKVVYEDKSGHLEIRIHEDLQPFLHQLEGNFTHYYIEQISNFKSVYSVRIYELCIMKYNYYKTIADNKNKELITFQIPIEELKKQLELSTSYNRFTNFKTRVLETSKKEINRYSDMKIDYEIHKENGRSPSDIIFHVKKKPSQEQRTKQ